MCMQTKNIKLFRLLGSSSLRVKYKQSENHTRFLSVSKAQNKGSDHIICDCL